MDERTPGRREWALALTAPALLVAVATVQVVRAKTLDQSAWSGGGFGMFRRYEGETTRAVRAYALEADGRARRVAIPAELEDVAYGVKVVPTAGRLDALAEALLDGTDRWIARAGAVRVEIRVIELDRDREGLEVRSRVLRAVEVHR